MSKVQSVWSTADKFLTLSRKIIVNLFTIVVLIVITFSLIGGIGSFFSEEESISTKDKILWFKPVGVVVDSSSNHRHLLMLFFLVQLIYNNMN